LIPTFSPQGDGNSDSRTISTPLGFNPVDPYLFPARGRKPGFRLTDPLFRCRVLIPTFSPQGDGNCVGLILADRLPNLRGVDPYLFPARGRKPYQMDFRRSRIVTVDPYLFPARGRKRNQPVDDPKFGCQRVDPYLFPARGRKLTTCCGTVLQRYIVG